MRRLQMYLNSNFQVFKLLSMKKDHVYGESQTKYHRYIDKGY